jgi:hypothetical protein
MISPQRAPMRRGPLKTKHGAPMRRERQALR